MSVTFKYHKLRKFVSKIGRREMPIIFSVNCGRTNLVSVKLDLATSCMKKMSLSNISVSSYGKGFEALAGFFVYILRTTCMCPAHVNVCVNFQPVVT